MTIWSTIVSWFYREFPCGCRVARRWNEARVCEAHRAQLAAGMQVILESKKINSIGLNIKHRNARPL